MIIFLLLIIPFFFEFSCKVVSFLLVIIMTFSFILESIWSILDWESILCLMNLVLLFVQLPMMCVGFVSLFLLNLSCLMFLSYHSTNLYFRQLITCCAAFCSQMFPEFQTQSSERNSGRNSKIVFEWLEVYAFIYGLHAIQFTYKYT